jgi:hypothetical protein
LDASHTASFTTSRRWTVADVAAHSVSPSFAGTP